MPYAKTKELPKGTKNLPEHAKHIYMEAFNNALEQYKDPKSRRNPEEDLETTASKVAWAAVKKEYKKDNSGNWIRKE